MARLTGRVARSVFVGDYVETIIEAADGELTVEIPSGNKPPPDGTEVAAIWNVDDMRVFVREAA
jgi:putative spermidine/putrescine transport system ATP-binding protein